MFQEIIVLTVAYIILIGLLQPSKHPTTTDPTAPINYFPEVEEAMPAQIVEVFAQDLSVLGIRSLYKLAKGKVKGYKKLSKAQLIKALQGLEMPPLATV